MCGIGGILAFEGAPTSRPALLQMGESLRHRGPDAQGVYEDATGQPGIGLVHRRLSIIDLSHEADQPLAGEDGSVLAMLNGEIYNFAALRRDLEPRHRFRSNGDTEVLVHGYEEYGEDIVSALDGMFALAIWDGRRRRLILARDPFGKKPLYYWSDARRFVFASEIKALLAAGVPAEMDDVLPEYLRLGYVPTPRTFFLGVRRLPPASILIVDATGAHEPRNYWDLRFPERGSDSSLSLDEAASQVRGLLEAAVRKRLMSDVPLGVLLSGGVDSSAVAALAVRLSSSRIRTFTVGFEGDAFYDERPHAREVARHIGSDHYEALIRPNATALLETLVHHHDEPFGDSSALPTYLVAQEARRHVTVGLSGDGGDETFAGYDRFHAALLAERIPASLRPLLRAIAGLVPMSGPRYGLLHRAGRFAMHAGEDLATRMASWTGIFSNADLLGFGLRDDENGIGSYGAALDRCRGASTLSQLLYLNARTYLLDDLLPKMDRMTMAHGLEARSPMLDRALVEYVATLPDAFKRHGRHGKIALRAAVADLLPATILRRRKQGFGVPIGEWFRTELRSMVEDTLLDHPRLASCISSNAVRDLWLQHVTVRTDNGQKLWSLLTLELWLRKHRLG